MILKGHNLFLERSQTGQTEMCTSQVRQEQMTEYCTLFTTFSLNQPELCNELMFLYCQNCFELLTW